MTSGSDEDSALDEPLRARRRLNGASSHQPLVSATSTTLNSGLRTSILLLGPRGSGKSTLGIIASVKLRRRLLDFESFFHQKTGQQWTSDYGLAESVVDGSELVYHDLVDLVSGFLTSHSNGYILICPSECLGVDGLQQLFRKFAQTHPVISIASDLTSGLSDLSQQKKASASHALNDSSNYTYYNLAEKQDAAPLDAEYTRDDHSSLQALSTRFLQLKRVEHDFVRFLSKVLRVKYMDLQTDLHYDTPMLERNEYTYVHPIHLDDLNNDKEVKGLCDEGLDAIELVVNETPEASREALFESISRGVTKLRRQLAIPLILHLQTSAISSSPTGKDQLKPPYLEVLLYMLRFCPDYLTVDLGCSDDAIKQLLSIRTATQLIGHHHDTAPGKEAWDRPERMQQVQRAKILGCCLVRLTQMATSQHDNAAAQHFVHRARTQVAPSMTIIAYNTGTLGRTSCCFNNNFTPVRLTGPVNHSSVGMFESGRDHLVTIQESQKALFSSFTMDRRKIYIFGTNVSASLSPFSYGIALNYLGIPHTFIPQSAAEAQDLLPVIRGPDFGGASIAQGLKITMLDVIDHVSPSARVIGAANTLIPIRCDWPTSGTNDEAPPSLFWRQRNHSGPFMGVYGENTDWVGMYRCVSKRLSPANAVNIRTSGLAIGAGGMARAAVYAMMRLGVLNIFIHNRTTSRAHEVAKSFNALSGFKDVSGWRGRVHVIDSLEDPWPEGFSQPTIIISCVRESPHSGQAAPNIRMPAQWLKSPHGGVVMETGYEPLLTPLMNQMHLKAQKGWIAVDGLHFLLEQSAAQFEFLTSRKAPRLKMFIGVIKRHLEITTDTATQQMLNQRLRRIHSELGRDLSPPSN